jgi:hypothetical protein
VKKSLAKNYLTEECFNKEFSDQQFYVRENNFSPKLKKIALAKNSATKNLSTKNSPMQTVIPNEKYFEEESS